MKRYDKLVRDSVPENIKANGESPVTRSLEDGEFKEELFSKLIEEAGEVEETRGDTEKLLEEIGDVLEVLEYIIDVFGLKKEQIEKIQEKKREEKGGFDDRIFLEGVE